MNYQINGGKLIGTGSGSCVFKPNLPCKGEKNYKKNKDRISKYIFKKNAVDLIDHEKKLTTKIKKIKNYENWAIIFDKYCKADDYTKLYVLDKQGFNDCWTEESIDSYEYEIMDKISYISSGKYGGITLEDHFIKKFSSIKQSDLEKEFMKLMKKITPLFEGLKSMNENKIIHNDIKGINIVKHNSVFKFIDFGLASHLVNKRFLKQRSLSEFNTTRIYIYYPLEYIYYYSPNLNNELLKLNNKEVRRHFYDLDDYYKELFNLDFLTISKDLIQFIQTNQIKENDMLKKIDVYSVGSLIPLLFMFESNIEFPNKISEKIQQFYNLFIDMTEPFSFNRISASEAYERFMDLISSKPRRNLSSKSRKVLSSKKRVKTKPKKRVQRRTPIRKKI